jgi:phenylpropionate dioxygenase-like ring-hydroxylating dioxygenase large terminal subunit
MAMGKGGNPSLSRFADSVGCSSGYDSDLVEWRERLAQGWTLPAEWYSESVVYKQEQSAIFRQAWHYVGHVEKSNRPGDYFTYQCGNVPVVVVRNAANQLRAFINICRHRACEVAAGAGQAKLLQCPYHAWSYDLDGVLRVAPGCDQNPDLDLAELNLVPVQIDQWGPFLFINLSPKSESLQTYLGVLPELLLATGVDIERLRLRQQFTSEMATNWKVIAENYLECYHCTFNHPSLVKMLDPDTYALSAVGNALIGKAPLRPHSQPPYSVNGPIKTSLFVLLWPNCTFTTMPGQGNLTVYTFNPVGSQQTQTFCEYFFDQTADEEFIQGFMDFDGRVGQEDVPLLESVQRGLQAGAIQGRLVLDREWLIQHFQKLVAQALIQAT